MTAPTEPMPGAPADPARPQVIAPPAAPATPVAPTAGTVTPPWERDGQTFDPERAWNLVEKLRAENEKFRTGRTAADEARTAAEATAAAAKERSDAILRAAGFNPDGSEVEASPEELVEQYLAQAEEARNDAWGAGANLSLYQIGAELGANVAALRDSVSFMDSLDELLELQPGSPDFHEAMTAKVQAALDASPDRYRTAAPAATPAASAAPRPDPSQGARGTPPSGRPTSLYDAINRHLASKG